jgi:hypothetical protein
VTWVTHERVKDFRSLEFCMRQARRDAIAKAARRRANQIARRGQQRDPMDARALVVQLSKDSWAVRSTVACVEPGGFFYAVGPKGPPMRCYRLTEDARIRRSGSFV